MLHSTIKLSKSESYLSIPVVLTEPLQFSWDVLASVGSGGAGKQPGRESVSIGRCLLDPCTTSASMEAPLCVCCCQDFLRAQSWNADRLR